MSKYPVLFEQADDGSWSASAVTLPVFAAGDTRADAEREIRSAIAFYIDELSRTGESVEPLKAEVATVSV